MASPAHIIAERVKGAYKQATAEQLQLLGVSTSDAIRYRGVRLHCGGYTLPSGQREIIGISSHLCFS
jgi:hypothetical protein